MYRERLYGEEKATPSNGAYHDTQRSFGWYNSTLGMGGSVTSYENLPATPKDYVPPSTNYDSLKARADSATETHASNTKAVVRALKGLQEKIKRLELERVDAEKNLKSIAVETDEYKEILRKEHSMSEATQSAVEHHNKELENQLSAAGERCTLLEKQLEYMRSLVRPTDVTVHPVTGQKLTMSDQFRGTDSADKLAELQREQIKFTASQTLAESKIRELEEKIKEERHQRKLLQDRATDLQTVAETNRLLLNLHSPMHLPAKVAAVNRKKKLKTRHKTTSAPSRPHSHYKLDLASIPFVVGQSTSKSHSLGANIQNVLSLMKSHNPHLCDATAKAKAKYPSRCQPVGPETEDSLADLLVGLQDEFGHLGFEHKEIAKRIAETKDAFLREDLERELDQLITKMEAKGQQIALVKLHQRSLKSGHPQHPVQRKDRRALSVKGSDLEVVTTVRSRSKTTGALSVERHKVRATKAVAKQASDPTHYRTHSNPNYDVLKKVQRLQTTLRKDDLSWD